MTTFTYVFWLFLVITSSSSFVRGEHDKDMRLNRLDHIRGGTNEEPETQPSQRTVTFLDMDMGKKETSCFVFVFLFNDSLQSDPFPFF
jgi:hypothetical protein